MSAQAVRREVSLFEAWRRLSKVDPRLSRREGAARLGVTEAELVAAHVGESAVRLDDRWVELLSGLEAVGTIAAVTRNGGAVIEQTGLFGSLDAHGPMGQVLGDRIDVRLFLSRWHVGFALIETVGRARRRSLQFFDEHGAALHEVHLVDPAGSGAWDDLVGRHVGPFQSPLEHVERLSERVERPDAEIDVGGLRAAWAEMRESHDLHWLLRQFATSRLQALRLAGRRWAEAVVPVSHRAVMHLARQEAMPLVTSVGNAGVVQIHRGSPGRLSAQDGWWNSVEPTFTLRLHEPSVASAWVVRRPTCAGIASSLELFDSQGEQIALFCCKRQQGQEEYTPWRHTLAALCRGA